MLYRELLQMVMHSLNKPGASDAKQQLGNISRKIAQGVTDLAAAAEQLKDDDWVDPSDPTFIAENELLGAAKSIENAAKKLASLKPRREIKGKASTPFDAFLRFPYYHKTASSELGWATDFMLMFSGFPIRKYELVISLPQTNQNYMYTISTLTENAASLANHKTRKKGSTHENTTPRLFVPLREICLIFLVAIKETTRIQTYNMAGGRFLQHHYHRH